MRTEVTYLEPCRIRSTPAAHDHRRRFRCPGSADGRGLAVNGAPARPAGRPMGAALSSCLGWFFQPIVPPYKKLFFSDTKSRRRDVSIALAESARAPEQEIVRGICGFCSANLVRPLPRVSSKADIRSSAKHAVCTAIRRPAEASESVVARRASRPKQLASTSTSSTVAGRLADA